MPLEKGVLFCMGNPLLDMSATVDKLFLEKYKMKPNDAILAGDDHVDLYKEMTEKFEIEYIAGGATQNTCRVFQWLVQQPERCVYMGCIGNDEYGKILESKAKEAGVDVKYQYDPTTPTGTCAVLLTEAHRSLCANLAAANCFKIAHLLKPENLALMEQAKFFYISGFFLTVSTDSMEHVGKHAAETGKIFAMNLSAPFICNFFKDNMMKVMPYVDILFGNESEAAELAKAHGWTETSVEEIAKRAANFPKERKSNPRMVVFTQGIDPVIVIKDGKTTKFPITPVDKIVDTNGAGDAFVGGFMASYVQGKDITVCVGNGIAAATVMIQQSGCSLPNRCTFTMME